MVSMTARVGIIAARPFGEGWLEGDQGPSFERAKGAEMVEVVERLIVDQTMHKNLPVWNHVRKKGLWKRGFEAE